MNQYALCYAESTNGVYVFNLSEKRFEYLYIGRQDYDLGWEVFKWSNHNLDSLYASTFFEVIETWRE